MKSMLNRFIKIATSAVFYIFVFHGTRITEPAHMKIKKPGSDDYGAFECVNTFAAGLCCGLCQIAAGYAIGIVGDGGVRYCAQNEQIFVGLLLILIFAEVLGLFGMIVSIIVGLAAT